MNLIEKTVLTTIATAGLVFGIVNFVTMKNEHHETLDLMAGLPAKILASLPVPPPTPRGGAALAKTRMPAPCPAAGLRTMVSLAIGQSNASNYGGVLTRSEHGAHIVEFYQGRCYVAEDPLIGADGYGGTPWVMLANRLVASGTYDDVVIATRARGGSSIAQWRTGGDLNAPLRDLSFAMATAGLPATHVFWVQGEAERSPASEYNNAERYSAALQEVVTITRHDAPNSAFYVAHASWCPLDANATGPQQQIRDGQSSLISPLRNIRAGADLDTIADWGDRFDICHLSAVGLHKFVDKWMNVLLPEKSKETQ